MRVTAAVARSPRAPFQIEQLELDELRPNEVRVRMVAAGVCHTDALVRDQVLDTPLPVVLGHEGAGVVEEAGSQVAGLAPGDQVVLGSTSCGRCQWCVTGHPANCESNDRLKFAARRPDGSVAFRDQQAAGVGSHFFGQSSFASHANVAERAVAKVPKDVPLELLAPLGCGMATGAGTVLNALQPWPGSSIAIFGAGAVGCAALFAARLTGCSTIIMIDIVQSRLDLARELGATHAVNSATDDPVSAIRDFTGDGVNFALDNTSSATVFRQMLDALAVRGRAARVGNAPVTLESAISLRDLMRRSQVITGVRQGDTVPQEMIPRLARLHADGLFPLHKLIRHYPISDINKAFGDAGDGSTIKPVVLFNEG